MRCHRAVLVLVLVLGHGPRTGRWCRCGRVWGRAAFVGQQWLVTLLLLLRRFMSSVFGMVYEWRMGMAAYVSCEW